MSSFLLMNPAVGLADDADVKKQLESLQKENAELKGTVRDQGKVIEKLNDRLDKLEKAAESRPTETPKVEATEPAPAPRNSSGFNFGKINISGEGAAGFFDSQRNGTFPNSEFRVDEAKLFIEAPVWNNVYFFSEINLAQRTDNGVNLNLGELYVDFEDVSQLWGKDRQLNIRVGRTDVPFGEEYLSRDAIDNPLISHSLTDFWGVDEGIELYGSFGKFTYVTAVQNGGVPTARDFNKDKSVIARLGYDPLPWLHLSLSGMRTGDLDPVNDNVSELWIGGGWFRSIGSAATTKFHADLVQGDVALNFSRGHVKMSGGYAHYDDNDPAANNRRDIFFYTVEGVCDVTRKFYAAARFSQMFAHNGYPLPGNGDLGVYYFSPTAPQAEDLWRLSLGLGYRFSKNLVIKAEYAFERGREVGGATRDHVNFFGTEAALKF